MQRAVLYGRVSSDDSRSEDRNLRGQLDMCRKYAQDHDYQIVAELHEDDRGASGAAFDLPQLNHIRDLADGKAFDVLIIRELDRFSRSLAKQLLIEEELQRRGVTIEYVLEKYADTPEGHLAKHVKASIAEFERLKIQERIKRGRVASVKAGSVLVGTPPFGYQRVKRNRQWTLEINAPEAQIIRQIFRWYTEGDEDGVPLSIYGIHKKLHADKVPSSADLRSTGNRKRRGFAEWNSRSIVRILGNETYAGTWHWQKTSVLAGKRVRAPKEEWLAVQVPAIITPETWEAATRRRVEDHARVPRAAPVQHMFAKHILCQLCGATVSARIQHCKMGPALRYVCPAHDRSLTQYSHICDLPIFRGDRLEQVAWGWLKSLLCDPVALTAGGAALRGQVEHELTPLYARLAAIERQLVVKQRASAQLLDQYLAGAIDRQTLLDRQGEAVADAELQQERADLLARLKAPTPDSHTLEHWQSLAAYVTGALAEADDLALRRYVVETLNVIVRLTVEDGQRVAYAGCSLGTARWVIA